MRRPSGAGGFARTPWPLGLIPGADEGSAEIERAEKALLGTRDLRKLPFLQVDEAEVVVKGMKARGPRRTRSRALRETPQGVAYPAVRGFGRDVFPSSSPCCLLEPCPSEDSLEIVSDKVSFENVTGLGFLVVLRWSESSRRVRGTEARCKQAEEHFVLELRGE